MGFNYVGSKITTFAEIYSIYFRDSDNSLETRSHTVIDGAEAVNIKKCTFDSIETSFIVKELENITMEYTNHYSNYNKKVLGQQYLYEGIDQMHLLLQSL